MCQSTGPVAPWLPQGRCDVVPRALSGRSRPPLLSFPASATRWLPGCWTPSLSRLLSQGACVPACTPDRAVAASRAVRGRAARAVGLWLSSSAPFSAAATRLCPGCCTPSLSRLFSQGACVPIRRPCISLAASRAVRGRATRAVGHRPSPGVTFSASATRSLPGCCPLIVLSPPQFKSQATNTMSHKFTRRARCEVDASRAPPPSSGSVAF